jgi:hypothetical protein
MKKIIILSTILIFFCLIISGCTDINVPDIPDELTDKMTIVTFTVIPSIIELGQNANLSWMVNGSNTIVNIDNGIGEVSSTGYRIISPTETTTYTLTATNNTSIKNATTEIIVTVNQSDEDDNQTVLTVEVLLQNKDNYVDKNITVEGYYYISIDGPSLISDTTVTNPNPDIWLNLDENSLNIIKKSAGDITIISNHKYHIEGVFKKIESPLGTNYYMITTKIIEV